MAKQNDDAAKQAEAEAKAAAEAEAKAQAEAEAKAKAGAPKLVKMVRELEEGQHGPATADVHPDEVANFKAGGWQVKK